MQNQPTLFWDFDGTLAHREGHQSGAMMYALDSVMPGHHIKRDQLRSFMKGKYPWESPQTAHHHLCTPQAWWTYIESLFAGAFVSLGVQEATAKHIARVTHEHYLNPDEFILFPNTIEVLASLQTKGWQHIILSNHVPELTEIVAAKGLSKYFSHVISSANVGYEKPNIELFKHAIQLAGNPEKMIMIGDNIHADVFGAKNAGLDAILIHTEPDDSIKHYARSISKVEAILELMR